MARAQLPLLSLPKISPSSGGGRGHLKTKRAFAPGRPMHLVMRSEHAVGRKNLKLYERELASILRRLTQRFFVRVHQSVNVGNHLHLKISARTRRELSGFLRSFAALLAREVTGSRRGKPFVNAKGEKLRFWTTLAFTRVLKTRFEELVLSRYFTGNLYEAEHGKEIRKWFFENYPLPLRGRGFRAKVLT